MLKLRGSVTETWLINNDRDRYERQSLTARIGKNEFKFKVAEFNSLKISFNLKHRISIIPPSRF
jgi:hypothetical protein